MVKEQDKDNAKRQGNQEEAGYPAKAGKIGHSTPYDYCNELLSQLEGFYHEEMGEGMFSMIMMTVFRFWRFWEKCRKGLRLKFMPMFS